MTQHLVGQRPIRFGLRSFFWLQLLVSPVCLAPVYFRTTGQSHPYLTLFAFLIAPTCYVAAFSIRAACRRLNSHSPTGRSIVFASTRRGGMFGLLFGAAAYGPLGVLAIYKLLSHPIAGMSVVLLREWYEIGLIAGFVVVHYAVLGSAIGGVVGLVVDCLSRHRSRRFAASKNAENHTA